MQKCSDDIEARPSDERHPNGLAEPERRVGDALGQLGMRQQAKTAHDRRAKRKSE